MSDKRLILLGVVGLFGGVLFSAVSWMLLFRIAMIIGGCR